MYNGPLDTLAGHLYYSLFSNGSTANESHIDCSNTMLFNQNASSVPYHQFKISSFSMHENEYKLKKEKLTILLKNLE